MAAGTIASSSGSASVMPVPRRTVRREMCFLVINIKAAFSYYRAARSRLLSPAVFMFIWNGGLFTIPNTIDENL